MNLPSWPLEKLPAEVFDGGKVSRRPDRIRFWKVKVKGKQATDFFVREQIQFRNSLYETASPASLFSPSDNGLHGRGL